MILMIDEDINKNLVFPFLVILVVYSHHLWTLLLFLDARSLMMTSLGHFPLLNMIMRKMSFICFDSSCQPSLHPSHHVLEDSMKHYTTKGTFEKDVMYKIIL